MLVSVHAVAEKEAISRWAGPFFDAMVTPHKVCVFPAPRNQRGRKRCRCPPDSTCHWRADWKSTTVTLAVKVSSIQWKGCIYCTAEMLDVLMLVTRTTGAVVEQQARRAGGAVYQRTGRGGGKSRHQADGGSVGAHGDAGEGVRSGPYGTDWNGSRGIASEVQGSRRGRRGEGDRCIFAVKVSSPMAGCLGCCRRRCC